MLKVFIPKESEPGETRVAATPETVKKLAAAKLAVSIEAGAGERATFSDAAYAQAGAQIEADRARGLSDAGLVLKLHPPRDDSELPAAGAALVSFVYPHQRIDLVRRMAERRLTVFAMELIPRISRAQPMDALSSQANIAGYKAVILAAERLGKLFPMLMTAAGTLKPAKVVILGAGVAGLQAVATARRLGALVEVSDIRPAVKEQVESLGAKFVAHEAIQAGGETKGGYATELTPEQQARQREALSKHIAEADAVICSALVPGRRAPVLLSEEQVAAMRPGSVVVDLAADQGGNCELTQPGQTVDHGGVRILAPLNVPSSVPLHASQMLSRNFQNFLLHLLKKGELQLDAADELNAGSMVTRDGAVVHPAVKTALGD